MHWNNIILVIHNVKYSFRYVSEIYINSIFISRPKYLTCYISSMAKCSKWGVLCITFGTRASSLAHLRSLVLAWEFFFWAPCTLKINGEDQYYFANISAIITQCDCGVYSVCAQESLGFSCSFLYSELAVPKYSEKNR